MATLSELLKELKTLPLGNVYRKKINGKTYFYHQYFSNGVRYSELIKKDDVTELKKQIARRKEIEQLIKQKKTKNITLSNNAKNLTGYVMDENVVTAEFNNGELVYINDELAPLIIKRTHSIEEFLKLRTMDMSRTNARILKKVLNINVEEDYLAPLYSYALSINDHYWFKPKHSKLTYIDLTMDNDNLFETSLKGEVNVFYHKNSLSPEITTTGSFEKGWRYINNEWWLYKVGNNKQYFSELFSSMFAKKMGIATIEYEMDNGYIKCRNFSPSYNFEPIASLAGDDDSYEHVFNIIFNINKNIAKDYLKLIFFDSVINNIDRHNENIGLLRNVKSGKIISLAPNFDNNLSLVATTDILNHPKKDGFIKVFVDFLNKNETAKKVFLEINFKNITLEDIKEIVSRIDIDIENIDEISEMVYIRYQYLKELFNKQHI